MTNSIGKNERVTKTATQKTSEDGTVALYQQVIKRSSEVILTIGVFFDGTGNNAYNTQARRNYQQILAQGERPNKPSVIYNTSYTNEDSNVYKLFQMYCAKIQQESYENHTPLINYQDSIYIEGVGTNEGEKDNYISMGTGLWAAGIESKIIKAIDKVKDIVNEFLDTGIKIKKIQFDVFGFSRGAATARYFANIVADQLKDSSRHGENNPLTKKLKPILDDIRSPKWRGNNNGEVRFLGIFDTVAGIGSLSNLFDAGDSQTFDIDITIRKETAQQGLHIQAANEYRYNFSFNDSPPFFKKIILSGSHSDIGGGYSNIPVKEDLYITPLHQYQNVLFHDKPMRYRERQSELLFDLNKFRNHPDLQYLFDGINENNFEIWEENIRGDDQTTVDLYGVIRIKRMVNPGLERIALRMMYDEAVDKGCVFFPFDNDYAIPTELIPVANKILIAAKANQSYQLDNTEKRLVLGHYAHCSAEFGRNFIEKEGELEIILDSTQERKTIPWPQYLIKNELKTSLLEVHIPNLNNRGIWQRLIHSN